MLIASAFLASFSAISVGDETYYRWIDERGHAVHSDRPPPEGVDYEVISTGSRFIRAVDSEEGAVPLDIEPSVGNEFEQLDSSPPKIEKNPEFCQRAMDNLEVIDSSVQIQMRDDSGDLRDLTEEEREVQRKKAEDTIAIHCE